MGITMIDSATANNAATANKAPLKLRFYRQCRIWHGYLSAFAFIALLFFAITGVMLNHPNWFASNEPRSAENLVLTPAQLQEVRASESPAELLTRFVADKTTLYGDYVDGAVAAGQVFVRLRGARGASDIRANLDDGSVRVTVERATTIGLLNALHRGETAGTAWQAYIDIIGGILIAMSLAGYAIFLSMSARLKPALLITASSVIATVLLFAVAVR
jgi:hypothetical protein